VSLIPFDNLGGLDTLRRMAHSREGSHTKGAAAQNGKRIEAIQRWLYR
jgi:hypothetical protein